MDQVRERVGYPHHSLQIRKTYVYWAKEFVLCVARNGGNIGHSCEIGRVEVEGLQTTPDTKTGRVSHAPASDPVQRAGLVGGIDIEPFNPRRSE